jgi:glycosyltransferase involved in cell wall biosynthesis
LRLAKTRNKPVVILPSLDDKLPGDPATLGRLLGAAAATLAVTEESAREISRLCSNCKISEIGIGVDPAAFDNAAISGARFRSKYDLGDRPFLFTPPGKGVDLALEAMYFFVPGSLLLVIAGEPSAGKLPSDRVKFVGPLTRAEMWDAYDACDVIMFASPEEKSRSPLLEAWARGKPVLANPNSEAASELMDDAVDGFLCDNSRTISKRAQLLLDHPALSRKMGEAGRRKLLAQHTWEQVAKRVRVVYESCGARCAIPQGQK